MIITEFISSIEEIYGAYKNRAHIKNITWYIEKFINPAKLQDVLCFVFLYYSSKTNPPITADIDYAIRNAIKDNRGNDPYKKQMLANEYSYDILSENADKKEVAELLTGLKTNLQEKAKDRNGHYKPLRAEDDPENFDNF